MTVLQSGEVLGLTNADHPVGRFGAVTPSKFSVKVMLFGSPPTVMLKDLVCCPKLLLTTISTDILLPIKAAEGI